MDTHEPSVVIPEGVDPSAASDPLFAVLSGALDGSRPVDFFSMLKTQLESQPNPKAAMVLRLLEQRRQHEAAAFERLQQEAAAESVEAEAQSSAAAQADLENVQQVVQTIYAELETLRARSAALAAAVGACPICFGEDPRCATCGGLGAPGSRRPEPAAFRQYVLPAFARARVIENRRADRVSANAPRATPPG
jgi:hypothetical protein